MLPADINNAGQIIGNFVTTSGFQHGFFYHGGMFTTIEVTGSSWTNSKMVATALRHGGAGRRRASRD